MNEKTRAIINHIRVLIANGPSMEDPGEEEEAVEFRRAIADMVDAVVVGSGTADKIRRSKAMGHPVLAKIEEAVSASLAGSIQAVARDYYDNDGPKWGVIVHLGNGRFETINKLFYRDGVDEAVPIPQEALSASSADEFARIMYASTMDLRVRDC